MNATTMRFKVSSQKAREKIIRRGMWNIVGVPMLVSKWSPKSEEGKQEDDAIPMWVHLEKVPLHMYSWEGLSFITSTVGLPVEPHPDTVACTNLAEAKIFVKVDVSKVLPKEITFNKDGKSFTVNFYYPWLPARCKLCDKWGHNEGVCGSKGKGKRNKNAPRSPSHINDGNKDSLVSPQRVEVVTKAEVENEAVTPEVMGSDEKIKSIEKEATKAGSSNKKGWTPVSPAKTGRFLLNAIQNPDVEVSVSKFSVLSIDEEEEGEISDEVRVQSAEIQVREVNEDIEIHDNDLLEDNTIEQQVQEETKVGKRRGRKPKAQDENPGKSSRLRRKH